MLFTRADLFIDRKIAMASSLAACRACASIPTVLRMGQAMPVYTLPARKLSTREEQALLAMVQAAPAPSAADDRRAAAGSRTATERRANQARRILVSFHTTPLLRAASALARRTQGLVSAAELVDSGLKGLNRAIDRFDASSYSPSGLRKYAAVWMRGEMRSCIRDKAAAMGTPRAVQAIRARVRAAALQLRDARGGVDALNTQEELVRLAGSWTCSDVAMLGVFTNCVCNQAQILRHASNECGDLQDAIASELQLPRAAVQAALSPMGTSLRWQPDSGAQPLAAPPLAPGEQPPGGMNRRGAMQAAIDGVLDTLSERERTILRLRYGLNREGQVVPREEICKALGITTLKITQIEHLAWTKIMSSWRQEFIAQCSLDLALLEP